MGMQSSPKQAIEPEPAAGIAAIEPSARKNYLTLVMRESGASNMLAPWHPAALRRNWPGVAICIAVGLSATFVSTAYGGPQLLYALFFGLAFHFLSLDPVCRPGI